MKKAEIKKENGLVVVHDNGWGKQIVSIFETGKIGNSVIAVFTGNGYEDNLKSAIEFARNY